MRHTKLPRATPRPITPRRVKHAERYLRKERENHPLFADQLAQEQESPEERIEAREAENVDHWQTVRDHTAATWKRARAIVFDLPADERDAILNEWQRSWLPGSAGYFADLVHRSLRQRDLP